MDYFFEGRPSDSPYIHMIWHGRTPNDYAPVCPADARWNLLFTRGRDGLKVSVEGPLTQYLAKFEPYEREFLVIKFRLGAFLPVLPAGKLVNDDQFLPEGAGKSFWLNGSVWQLPDFDNVETFVDRLVRENVLLVDPVVSAVMQAQLPDYSSRTVRRRFLSATGLTPRTIQQIERAQAAQALLEQGASIVDTTYELGYADQPHLTRSLRRFIGATPAQIARVGEPALV